tara:strand:+ start:74 stop:688 length:615 start_codon:yes stop_codon:yes gene_type:complete
MANLGATEVKFSNFFETTLNGILASGATNATLTAAPTSDGTSAIAAPYYLVIDPDSPSNREVVAVTAASGTSISTMTRDIEGRHTTDPTHVDGTTVRMSVVKEMFEDVHDRINADVALGTGTSGNYVQDVAAGNGLSKTSSAGEGQSVDLQLDINGATDGTGIVVDVENDLVLVYDNSATAVKKVKANQVAPPVEVHPFLVMGG